MVEELGKIPVECNELSDAATILVRKPKGKDRAAECSTKTRQIKTQQASGLHTQAFGKSDHLRISVQS